MPPITLHPTQKSLYRIIWQKEWLKRVILYYTRPSVSGLMSEIIALLNPTRWVMDLLFPPSNNFCGVTSTREKIVNIVSTSEDKKTQ